MQQDKKIKSEVYKDCIVLMWIPMLIYGLGKLLAGILYVLTASVLGEFADAAFALDLALGLENAGILIGCVIATVCLIPLITLWGDDSMFKRALRHDCQVFERFLQKESEKVRSLDTGKQQYQLEDAPNMLRIHWVNIWSQALVLPISWGCLLYGAGKVSWKLTGVMLLVSILKLGVPVCFRGKLAKLDQKAREYQGERRAYETDLTRKPHLIKLWGLGGPLLERMQRQYEDYYEKTEKVYLKYQVLADAAPALLGQLGTLFLFVIGAVMVAKGCVTPGAFAAMLAYLTAMQILLTQMGQVLQEIPLMKNAASRVCEIYQDQEELAGEIVEHLEELTGKHVGFAYSDQIVLEHVDFIIRRGERIRITGENGSGKSTLAKVICALLKKYQGTVTVNGIDFLKIHPGKWRQLVAYVPQTPYLFRAAGKENLVLGNEAVTEEEVQELMAEFGISHLADRVIERPDELSGGEKQKISIVRALLKKSELLILDEPANFLDQESIAALKRRLDQARQAVILISHGDSLEDGAEGWIEII